MGGNIVLVLGGKWRFHYYAHLQRIDTQALRWVKVGEPIGTVGTSGNAKGKPNRRICITRFTRSLRNSH